ncbi:hypothetical protein LIER_42410 [Lithospermum erythrorhizon]|uniref:Uncharacterized protein n=1 Tax=Lithospermum erythrorhizon TaxID=34254 RepID=A0AAV3RUD7_LITER
MSIANKLRSNGEEIPNSEIVEKILRTLSDQFTYLVVSVEESRDIDNMYVDDLQSTLNMHAQKLNRRHKEEDDQVLKVEEISYIRGKRSGSLRGRYGNGRGRGRSTFNKATMECFKCHKTGHF